MDEWKTIKELKENINELDKTENELSIELDLLNTDYKLKGFLRNDLTLVELNKIRFLVGEYDINKNNTELEIINKIKERLPIIEEKKILLEEKRKLYSWLIPYIDPTFKDDYINYIKWDAKIFNEQRDIETDIIIKREILSNKVDIIETKIQEHRDFIDESIKKVIESRLDEKIQNLNNNPTFQILNDDSKNKVLEKTIRKIKIKLQNLENSQSSTWSGILLKPNTNTLDKKIQTYNIAVEKLETFKNNIK